jgi:hypothetical protein
MNTGIFRSAFAPETCSVFRAKLSPKRQLSFSPRL